MTKLIAFIIFGLIILTLVSSFINLYNRLVMLKNNVAKSFANIDVLLKQRADEIPNLIKVVKESMKYEKGLLESLTEMRTRFLNTTDMNEKVSISNEIEKSLQSILAVAENYPDLKANSSLIELQHRVSELEDHISDRRELYNESVNMYNIGIAEFPNVILAKILSYKPMNLLYISDAEKEYHGVQF